MADLLLDMGELHELYQDLHNASAAFSAIPRVTEELAHSVGHDALARRVLELESSWDLRRKDLIASLDAAWTAARAIHDNFQKLDQQIAHQLEAQ